MSRLTRTLSATSLAAVVSAALVAAPSSALAAKPAPPDTVDLVTGSMPEGISAGPRDTFFAGARSDGAVYVGNTRNGQLRTLVKGQEGEVAVGLCSDQLAEAEGTVRNRQLIARIVDDLDEAALSRAALV